MLNDPFMAYDTDSLETWREEILDELSILQEREGKYYCYGHVWQWINDFRRKLRIEHENKV